MSPAHGFPDSRGREPNYGFAANKGAAAIYCRVSTDKQDVGLSFATQSEHCRRHGEILGFTLKDEDIFDDGGITGMTDERPGFRRLMLRALSPEKPYKAVIVLDISRLSRDSGGYIDFEEIFAEANIELISIMDPPGNPEVKINTNRRMKAVMNEAQVVDGALKTRNSQMLAVEIGFFIGWVQPFGYRKKKVVWRGAEHTKLEPDPETWPHLLHAIDMAKSNHTLSEIRQYLESTGFKHPAGLIENKKPDGRYGSGEWTRENVSYLLKNLALLGWTVRGGEGSGSRILHKSEQVICRDAHPAAMEWDDRELILKNLASRRSEVTAPKIHSSPNLMADFTICGNCGSPMQMHTENAKGKTVQRLICANNRRYRKVDSKWCPNPSIRLDLYVERTLTILLGHILTPDVLQRQVGMVAEQNRTFVTNQVQRQKAIDKGIKKLEREISSIVDASADPKRERSPEVISAYDQGIQRRQQEIQLLKLELDAINVNLQDKLVFVNERDRVIENALSLRTYLESEDPHSVKEMLKCLIKSASIVDRVATVVYRVPLPRDGTSEPALRDLVPLGKGLVHP